MKRKKSGRLPPFTPTPNNLIDSDCYKKLTNAARVAYLLLCRQKKRFDQTEVCLPYSHAVDYMHKITWNTAIKQLAAEGLIEITQKGGLFRKTNIYTIK